MKNFLSKSAVFLAFTLCSTCNIALASDSDGETDWSNLRPLFDNATSATQVTAVQVDQTTTTNDDDLPTKLTGLKLLENDSDDDAQPLTPRTIRANSYTDQVISGLDLSDDCPEQDALDEVFRALVVQFGERDCPGMDEKLTGLIAKLRAAADQEARLAIIDELYDSHPEPDDEETNASATPLAASTQTNMDDID